MGLFEVFLVLFSLGVTQMGCNSDFLSASYGPDIWGGSLWWGVHLTIVFGTKRSTSTVGCIVESDGGWRVFDGICHSAGVG